MLPLAASLALLLMTTFMQQQLPGVLPPVQPTAGPVQQPNKNDAPGGGGGSTTSPRSTGETQVITKQTFADYVLFGTDQLLTSAAKGGFEAVHQLFGVAPWLYNRNRDNTLNQKQSFEMDGQLRWAMLGLVPLAVSLAILSNVLGVLSNRPVQPGLVFGSTLMVGFGALVGFYNRIFFGLIVDVVGSLFATIAGADISAMVSKGLDIGQFTEPLVGPVLAILYVLVSVALTFVWWIQWGWVLVTGAALSVAVLAAFTPWVAPFGRQVIKRFIGTLIDPFIMLVALRLGSPYIDGVNAPTAATQVMTIAFLIVAWQSPGFFAGALGGSSSWLAQAYMLSRLAGLGRFAQGGTLAGWMGAGASGATAAAGAVAAGAATGAGGMPTPNPTPARWQPVPWGVVRGQGGGNAIHNKLGGPELPPGASA